MIPTANSHRLLILAACWLALLSGPARAQAPAGPAPSSQRGTLSGRVVSDSGQPVAGATVHVRLVGPNRSMLTTSTDEDGRFNAEGLEAGPYHVYVLTPGYVMFGQPAERSEEPVYRPGDSANIILSRGGVITGSVTDARGEPVVGVSVRAILVRDALGRPVSAGLSQSEGQTDDRGVYRIYGLAAGGYLVAAGGASQPRPATDPYRHDAPTFHPSGTRDGAAEVRVDLGSEAKGIDIRYRGGVGYALGGTVAGLPAGATVWLTLNYAGTDVTLATVTATRRGGGQSFAFYGVPEGEYTLQALGTHHASQSAASATQRVTVKGADVTGLNISLAPLGSIAGRIQFERNKAAGQECQAAAEASPTSIALTARRDEKGPPAARRGTLLPGVASDRPGESGEFVLRGIEGGVYRVEMQLPGREHYLGSITYKPAAQGPASRPADAARDGLTLRPGEKIEGVTVTLIDGAASLQGRVTPKENSPAPTRLYLVPAEREAADDVLRYAETAVAPDGSFGLTNLAPGRYRVVTRTTPATAGALHARPVAWDATGRAQLRREAEAANVPVELRPCQQVEGYDLQQPSPLPSGKPTP